MSKRTIAETNAIIFSVINRNNYEVLKQCYWRGHPYFKLDILQIKGGHGYF